MHRQSPVDMLVENTARRLAAPRTSASFGAFASSLSPVDDEPAIFIRCPDLNHRRPRCKGTNGAGAAGPPITTLSQIIANRFFQTAAICRKRRRQAACGRDPTNKQG